MSSKDYLRITIWMKNIFNTETSCYIRSHMHIYVNVYLDARIVINREFVYFYSLKLYYNVLVAMSRDIRQHQLKKRQPWENIFFTE